MHIAYATLTVESEWARALPSQAPFFMTAESQLERQLMCHRLSTCLLGAVGFEQAPENCLSLMAVAAVSIEGLADLPYETVDAEERDGASGLGDLGPGGVDCLR